MRRHWQAVALITGLFLRRRARVQTKRLQSGVVLDEALQLVRMQLLAQIADDGSLDVRATGIVGFNGALVAATIGAKNLLGTYWYAPLFPVGISIFILIVSLFGELDR